MTTIRTNKTKILHVHVTPALHRQIKLAAADCGMTVQDWIRSALERYFGSESGPTVPSRFADWIIGGPNSNVVVTNDPKQSGKAGAR